MGSQPLPNLLVVDFTNDKPNPGSSAWSATCKDIRVALENHGCFIALYDGVSSDLEESVFKAADDLFDLPTETKMKNVVEKPYHGYVGNNPYIPLHEGLGIDYATEIQSVESFIDLMWPNGNPSFCETALSFSRAVAKLEQMVIRLLFESYGVEKETESHINSTTYLLKFLKYRAPEIDENTGAFPSHTDKSFLTILHQNQVPGLEVRSRNDEWISVEFPLNSFLVMAGDACQAWSNNMVLSASHKVTLDRKWKETRYTMGLFSFFSKKIQVPDELVDDEHPLQYKPFDHIDLLKFYETETGGRSQNILKDFCGV